MAVCGPSDRIPQLVARALDGDLGTVVDLALYERGDARRALCAYALECSVVYVSSSQAKRKRFLANVRRVATGKNFPCIRSPMSALIQRTDGERPLVYAVSPRRAEVTTLPVFVDDPCPVVTMFRKSRAVVYRTRVPHP